MSKKMDELLKLFDEPEEVWEEVDIEEDKEDETEIEEIEETKPRQKRRKTREST